MEKEKFESEDYESYEDFVEDMEDMMFPEGRDDGFDVDDFCGDD